MDDELSTVTRAQLRMGRVALALWALSLVLLARCPFLLHLPQDQADPSWNQRAAGPRAISLVFVISSLARSRWQNCFSGLRWDGTGGDADLPARPVSTFFPGSGQVRINTADF